jgi:hypothetical protein
MALDHSIEGLPIDAENPSRSLLVSSSVFEHARDVGSFNLR